MRESRIQARILKYLSTVSDIWYFNTHGSNYAKHGIPDIIGGYCGKFFAFEVKQPGEHPTKLQEATMEKMQKAGIITSVVYGENKVRQIIEQIKADS